MIDNAIQVLNTLCPMYLQLCDTGHIQSYGPTIGKLRPNGLATGQRFLEVFELVRPRSVTTMADLRNCAGKKLHLRFRDKPQTPFKGALVPLPGGGAIVNLSFGIAIIEGASEYTLTSADFAATDLTVEMLYLMEAKSAAMEASRQLNLRLRGAMIAAEEQAFTDTLTGLKNRRAMYFVLGRLQEARKNFALMHIDLDYFKQVNDTLGHAAGDQVLQNAARKMVEETRDEDTVVRIGGDEFLIIFDKLSDRKHLNLIATRLLQRLDEPIPFHDQVCRISGSIGIVVSDDLPGADADTLLEAADIALYASKRAGRARYTVYSPALRNIVIVADAP